MHGSNTIDHVLIGQERRFITLVPSLCKLCSLTIPIRQQLLRLSKDCYQWYRCHRGAFRCRNNAGYIHHRSRRQARYSSNVAQFVRERNMPGLERGYIPYRDSTAGSLGMMTVYVSIAPVLPQGSSVRRPSRGTASALRMRNRATECSHAGSSKPTCDFALPLSHAPRRRHMQADSLALT